jgi:hypothetical protein
MLSVKPGSGNSARRLPISTAAASTRSIDATSTYPKPERPVKQGGDIFPDMVLTEVSGDVALAGHYWM